MKERLRIGKIKREIEILKTKMYENLTNDVEKVTFDAIENSSELSDVLVKIKTHMRDKWYRNKSTFLFNWKWLIKINCVN